MIADVPDSDNNDDLRSKTSSQRLRWWKRNGPWLLLALPWIACALLVNHYCVNQRVVDDWMFAEDLLKFKQGTLTFDDLWAVQMEHRLFVPRVISLALGVMFRGDVRAQCVMTVLFWAVQYVFVLWIWRKNPGFGKTSAIVGGLLSGLILFHPVQWETMLFPICFFTTIPLACLTGMIRGVHTEWSPWVRLLICLVCAWIAMLSFAPGLLTWFLLLPIFLWVMPMPSTASRRKFVIAWFVLMGISLAAYFHNFHNNVHPAYSYGQGNVNVLERDSSYFFKHPAQAMGFYIRWLGSFLSHGLHSQKIITCTVIGTLQLGLMLGIVIYTWWRRKETDLRNRLLIWICYAGYTLGTGAMVTMGRLWMEPHEGTSMNMRYHVHQSPLIIALLASLWIIGKRELRKPSEQPHCLPSRLGWALIGGFAMMLSVGWSYGANMMSLWSKRMLREQSAQRFWGLAQENFYLNKQVGDFDFGKRVALGLSDLGYLHKRVFASANLSQYKIHENARKVHFGSFDRLWKDDEGKWRVRGFALLRDNKGSPGTTNAKSDQKDVEEFTRLNRSPDLIIFAYRHANMEAWKMFGFTMVDGIPSLLQNLHQKDMMGIGVHTSAWPKRMIGEWDEEVALLSEPPQDSQVSAWALDAASNTVFRVAFNEDFKAGKNTGMDIDTLSQEGAKH